MQSIRQLGGGVIIALISLVLVIGGISLALSETLPAQATPTPIPPTISLDFPTATFTVSPVSSEWPTATSTLIVFPTDTAFATNTLFVQASCIPPSGWIRVTTTSGDSIYSLAQRYKTTPENLGAANCLSSFDVPAGFIIYVPPVPTVTVIPCGPPVGYVKRHVVQRGDTLYSIATSYSITYPVLQRANCMGSSTTIYAGQLLWVPNVPTRTPAPGVTIIPTFPTVVLTDTLVPTAMPTFTFVPPTSTFTSVPTVPPTFTPSNTPVTPASE